MAAKKQGKAGAPKRAARTSKAKPAPAAPAVGEDSVVDTVGAPMPAALPGSSGKSKRGGKKDRKSGAGRDARPRKDKESKKKKADKPAGDSGTGKMVRDSFTMPSADYALIGSLKTQALAVGHSVKKSELLRAGLITLARLPISELVELISGMPKIKTGRPKKKKK